MADVKKILNDLMTGTSKVSQQSPELIQGLMKLTGEIFKEGALSVNNY